MSGVPLILASASPRRRALLEQAGIEFSVLPVEGVESRPEDRGDPVAHARASAEQKALAASRLCAGALALGADTVVAAAGRAMGKPGTLTEAGEMLAALSGRVHEVHTGVALAWEGEVVLSDVVTTRVTFRRLSPAEIEAYVVTGEPMDKAGAYGIQESGALLVQKIDGCYSNVVGLPLTRTREMLAEAQRVISNRRGGGQC